LVFEGTQVSFVCYPKRKEGILTSTCSFLLRDTNKGHLKKKDLLRLKKKDKNSFIFAAFLWFLVLVRKTKAHPHI